MKGPKERASKDTQRTQHEETTSMWITIMEHIRAVVFASVGLALGLATGAFGGAALGAVSMYRAAYGESMDAVLQMTNRGVNIKWGSDCEDVEDDGSEDDYYLFQEMDEDNDSDGESDEEFDSDETTTEEDGEECEICEEDEETEPKTTAPPTSLRDALPAMRPLSTHQLRRRRQSFL